MKTNPKDKLGLLNKYFLKSFQKYVFSSILSVIIKYAVFDTFPPAELETYFKLSIAK